MFSIYVYSAKLGGWLKQAVEFETLTLTKEYITKYFIKEETVRIYYNSFTLVE